jgi:ParB family chromosome partitioning protein
MKRTALGRGLDALIPGAPASEHEDAAAKDPGHVAIKEIPIDRITPNPDQPRRSFDSVKLAELAESIKEQGVIQPVVLRQVNDTYQLIVGERRFKAVEKLGWEKIPSLVLESVSNETAMELALIENLQREDLDPIEEAGAYNRLMTECSLSQADVAARIGKERSSVANSLRLLTLSEKIQKMLIDGSITAGHGRALLAVPVQSEREALAERAAKSGMSVRELEKSVYADKSPRKTKGPKEKSAQIVSIEESLKRKLATRVTITRKRKGGKITIEYYSADELNRLLEIFGVLESI